MLDVPALALSLTAVVLFLRAADRDSLALAALAGLVAGLAAETKYTGFLAPAVMLLYAVLYGKLHLWPAAAVLAVQTFVSWEFLTALLYGQSHFLLALRDSHQTLLQKASLWAPLLGILGTVAPALILLGLVALRAPRWVLVLTGVVVLAAYASTACFGLKLQLEDVPFVDPKDLPLEVPLELLVFGALGLVLAGVLAAASWQLCPLPPMHIAWWRHWRTHRERWFLILWLGLEVAGFFMLTPFPAVRRLFGVVVVATLILGCLASRRCRTPSRVRLVYGVAGFSAVLGLAFAALDFLEGWTEKSLAESAAALVRSQDDSGTVWFLGHWGFQFYAERAGMQPVIVHWTPYRGERDYVPVMEPSHLRAGDWLVVPDWQVHKQLMYIDPDCTEERFVLSVRDVVLLRTVICYYSGNTALTHRSEPARVEVKVYRVTADFAPVWSK
jgi:hypothetical protein